MNAAARLFAAVFAVGCGAAAYFAPTGPDPRPWLVVCAISGALGVWSTLSRAPAVLCAAMAGLVVTWSGALAPRGLEWVLTGRYLGVSAQALPVMLAVAAGLVVLLYFSLRSSKT